jgi:hypothetical protein
MSSGRPSDRILGRLARHLSGENATSLASKLRLPQGNIEADAAISDWSDADMQRLKLLCRWKEVFPEHATDTLLNMLAEQRNYDVGELQNVIENEISQTEDFGKKCILVLHSIHSRTRSRKPLFKTEEFTVQHI